MAFDMRTDKEKKDEALRTIASQKRQAQASRLKGAGKGAGAALNSSSGAEGAVQGGMAAGPMGAIAGAALGTAKGLAAQSKKRRELNAQSLREQGDIIQRTAANKNQALDRIMEGLRSAFIF